MDFAGNPLNSLRMTRKSNSFLFLYVIQMNKMIMIKTIKYSEKLISRNEEKLEKSSQKYELMV